MGLDPGVLNLYERVLGKKLNREKTSIFFN
jgi:hypothetical protein